MSDALLGSSFRSVSDLWQHRVGSTPESEAMRYRHGSGWVSMSWGEAGARVRAITNALLAHGLARGDRCALLSGTRVEWILADFGILCAGGATTTIYPQASDAELAHILRDSEARVVFVDTDAAVDRVLRVRADLPGLAHVVVFDGRARPEHAVTPLATWEAAGRDFGAAHPEAYVNAAHGVSGDDVATLMYTSGTTGLPKGVMLTHDAWVYECEAIDALGFMNPADVQYLWLPLAHVFAKVLEVSFVRLGIPTIVDGDTNRLVEFLAETRPTWFAGVPRTFEKAKERIEASFEARGPVARRTFAWALDVGRRRSEALQRGDAPNPVLRVEWRLADRLVFRQIRARFGGRLRFLISGGAPLPREVAEFFHAADMLLLEGYGLTESSGASTVNRLDAWRFGTVGPPLPGCSVKIGPDGEILLKSRGIMKGYWRDPDATARVLIDGWLHTGDLGQVFRTGHVEITGRKKELIVTAGGKNVAPLQVESLLRTRCPYVSQVVLHGDRRPFCTALVTLERDAVTKWARGRGVPFADLADLSSRPEVRELLQGFVDAANRELPAFEQIKRFTVLPEDFTFENGLLTPSLKVKRREVEARYAPQLEAMYDRQRTPGPTHRR
jgi:long-chain acyl-CoA synthetase